MRILVLAGLAAEIGRAMQLPEVRERFAAMGSDGPAVRTPVEFTAFVQRELETYAGLVKRSGASVD